MIPTTEPTVLELAADLASLRRARRRDRIALVCVGLAALAWASAREVRAAPQAPSIDVKSLILRDDLGNARAKLSMAENGPRLVFADAAGHARFILGGDGADNPIFAMADAKGGVRIWMTIEPFGPSFNMKDAKGVVRSSLVVTSGSGINEGPRFELSDPKREPRVILRANDVEAGIRVGGGEGAGFGGLRWADAGPRLDLVGPDGKVLFRSP